eukprot:455545-Prymnesium_polylepis.1
MPRRGPSGASEGGSVRGRCSNTLVHRPTAKAAPDARSTAPASTRTQQVRVHRLDTHVLSARRFARRFAPRSSPSGTHTCTAHR